MPFLTGYTKRKKITIDNTYVDSDLTNFPLLVKFTNDADIGADIDSNGYNVRFTSSDGTTELKYERQSFSVNGSNQATGVFWVKVPTVAGAADTDIYIYYKAASPSDGQDAANVWDSNFVAVYHMEQDPSGSAPQLLDSTANNNDGTSAGSMTSGDLVSGKVGNAIDFDGSDDTINLGTDASLFPSDDMTFSAVIKIASTPPAAGFIVGSWPNIPGGRYAFNIDATPKISTGFRNSANTDSPVITGTTTLSTATWYHVAGTLKPSTPTAKVFVNGADDGGSLTGSGTGYYSNTPHVIIGALRPEDNYGPFPGVIEEVRISSVVRSDAWIKFEYRNIFEADNEIAFAAQETDGGINADCPIALLDFTPVVMTGAKSITLTAVPIKLTPVAPTTKHDAAFPADIVLLSAPSITTSLGSALDPGLLKLTPIPPTAAHSVDSGIGLLDLTPISPSPSKEAASGVALLDFTPVSPTATFTVTAGLGLLDITPVIPTTTKTALSGIGLLDFSAPLLVEPGSALPVTWIKGYLRTSVKISGHLRTYP